MKKIIIFCLSFVVIINLMFASGCQKDENTIIIGTMTYPGEVIIKFIKEDYESKGYKLKITLFPTFETLNPALDEGSIDVNLFQHEPYLNAYNESNNSNLASVVKLYTCNYNAYSKKISSIDDLPNGAKVTIANDASNRSRCLRILESYDLITLPSTDQKEIVTVDDIITNPKNLKIVEINAALIPSTLDDSDCYLGIVNATFALNAKLNETAKVVMTENVDDMLLNANILACRSVDKDAKWLEDLIEVLTSKKCKDFIEEKFSGIVYPVF